jgi:transposase InsO family protein
MQIRGLPGHVTRNAARASRLLAAKTPDFEAARRRDALARWATARAHGLTAHAAAAVVGVPASTLYRWQKQAMPGSRRPRHPRKAKWPTDLVQAVERLRLDFPMWGKDKIAPLLAREGFKTSASTVGRILKALVARGVVEPVPLIRRAKTRYARKSKRKWAQRLPRDIAATKPGGLVQLDTVHLSLGSGNPVRQFTAYCPIAKWTVAKAYRRATASAAAMFLDKLERDFPFKVEAIQVDGGSEFMAEFEDACRQRGMKLYVLPPKSPQMNGGVERCNGAWRYEFYAVHDLPTTVEELNPMIDGFQHLYNHHRPHGALGGLTPAEYRLATKPTESPVSHRT